MQMAMMGAAAAAAGGAGGPASATMAAQSGARRAPHEGVPLFVFQLRPEHGEEFLYQLFCKYGTVSSVKVVRDPQTGRSKVHICRRGCRSVRCLLLRCCVVCLRACGYLMWRAQNFGFVNMVNLPEAQIAIQRLNGMDLGDGRVLQVRSLFFLCVFSLVTTAWLGELQDSATATTAAAAAMPPGAATMLPQQIPASTSGTQGPRQ